MLNLGDPVAEARQAAAYIKRTLQGPLVGVEVGVSEGMHAWGMLSTLTFGQLWLVDPYIPYDDGGYWVERHIMDGRKEQMVVNTLEEFPRVVSWIDAPSAEAAKRFPDGHLDFVYIDANHTYESVRDDIEIWTPKVRFGGIISGHDFHMNTFGVIKAVIEFAGNRGFVVFNDTEWAITKDWME